MSSPPEETPLEEVAEEEEVPEYSPRLLQLDDHRQQLDKWLADPDTDDVDRQRYTGIRTQVISAIEREQERTGRQLPEVVVDSPDTPDPEREAQNELDEAAGRPLSPTVQVRDEETGISTFPGYSVLTRQPKTWNEAYEHADKVHAAKQERAARLEAAQKRTRRTGRTIGIATPTVKDEYAEHLPSAEASFNRALGRMYEASGEGPLANENVALANSYKRWTISYLSNAESEMPPGLVTTRRRGTMPEWAQAEYDNALETARAKEISTTMGGGGLSVGGPGGFGLVVPEKSSEALYETALAEALLKMTPEAQLALARAEREIKENKKGTVDELDLGVYEYVNNWAKARFGRGYASPEEMLEFFAEDHALWSERNTELMRALGFSSQAEVDITEQGEEFNALADYYMAAKTLANDRAVKLREWAVRIEAQVDELQKQADEGRSFTSEYKTEKAELDNQIRVYETAVGEYLKYYQETLIPMQSDLMAREKLFNKSVEQELEAKDRRDKEAPRRMIGLLTGAERMSPPVPYFTDENKRHALADMVPPDSITSTALMFSASEAYFDKLRAAFDTLIETNPEDVEFFYGTVGPKMQSAANRWEGKLQPGDVVNPMGWDQANQEYAANITEHRKLFEGAFMQERLQEIMAEEPNTPRKDAAERARQYARKEADLAILAATTHQKAPWINPDPDRKYEMFMNGENWQGYLAWGLGKGLEHAARITQPQTMFGLPGGLRGLSELAERSGLVDHNIFDLEDERMLGDSFEMGVGRQMASMFLPWRQIAGKIYLDGNEKVRVAPGPAVEGWGPAWRPVDTVIRWLGMFGSEAFSATAAHAKAEIEREFVEQGGSQVELDARREAGYGSELLQHMVREVGSPGSVMRMLENTDNTGPWLMSFPEHLFGNRDETWQRFANNSFRAGMLAGLFTEPTPIEIPVVGMKLAGPIATSQAFRKLTGVRDVNEFVRKRDTFRKIIDQYTDGGDLRTLENLPGDQLQELLEKLVKTATTKGKIDPAANVLIRSILNEAGTAVSRRFQQEGSRILAEAHERADALQDAAFRKAGKLEEVAEQMGNVDATQGVRGLSADELDDIEKVFVMELEDIIFQLENLRGAISTQTRLWSLQGAAIESLNNLEKLYEFRQARAPDLAYPIIGDVMEAISNIAYAKGTSRIKAVEALGRALDFSRPELQGILRAANLTEEQVLTYINQILEANRVNLDELLLEARAVYGRGPTGRGIPRAERPKNLRKRRAALRKQAAEIIAHSHKYGAQEQMVELLAKRAATERNLAMNLESQTRLVVAARKWLQNMDELPKGRTASLLQVDDALRRLKEAVDAGDSANATVRSQAARLRMIAKSAQGMRDVADASAVRAIINTMQFLDDLAENPDMLRRIIETTKRGWLVDEAGRRMKSPEGDAYIPYGRDRTIYRKMVELEDAQIDKLVTTALREGASLEEKADFLREFFLRGDYIASLFRDPRGLLFRGATGGFTTYAQALGLLGGYGLPLAYGKAILGYMFGAPVSAAAEAAMRITGRDPNSLGLIGDLRTYVYYGRAQFRKGGGLYGFRSYFERQLGVSSVNLSERLEQVMIRIHADTQMANNDINKFVAFNTKALERRLRVEKAAKGAPSKEEILETFQRAWYQYVFTTTKKLLVEEPWAPTPIPRSGGKKWAMLTEDTRGPKRALHELTAFLHDSPIVVDAVDHLLYTARSRQPLKKGGALRQDYRPADQALNQSPAYMGMLHAFLPSAKEAKRSFTLEEYIGQVQRFEEAVFNDLAKRFVDKNTGFVNVRNIGGTEVYETLYNIIIKRTDEFFGTKYGTKGAAMTHRIQHLAIYHNSMLLTASHNRAMKALREELPNFHPSMYHTANVLLSNFKDVQPPVVGSIEVGMNVIPLRKLQILQREMDVGHVRGYDQRGKIREGLAEPYARDLRIDDAEGPMKRIYEAEDVYWRLDPTPASIVEEIITRKELGPKGRKRDVRYLRLENGRVVTEADYVAQANYAPLAFLDGLEVMSFWGMRNMDNFLEEEAASMFLTMRKRLDKQYQRFVIEMNSNDGMQMIPANALTHLQDTMGEFRKLLYDGQWTQPPSGWEFFNKIHAGQRAMKQWLLIGTLGVARNAMMFVQGFGDFTNQITTGVPIKNVVDSTTNAFFGYLGPRAARAWDESQLARAERMANDGANALDPMIVAVNDPLLSRILRADPEDMIEIGVNTKRPRKVSAFELFQWQRQDVGMPGIVSEGADEAMERVAQGLAKRYSHADVGPVRDAIIRWGIVNGHVRNFMEGIENFAFLNARLVRHSTEEGTRRTRQALYVKSIVEHGNRELAREMLNYSLMNWLSGTTYFDMRAIGTLTVFTTFFREMLRQGFLSWFDYPSTTAREYFNRRKWVRTGPQRNEVFIRYRQMRENEMLEPSEDMTYEEAQEYSKRRFYPDYNFDRVLIDYRAFDAAEQQFFEENGMPYTSGYRALPGVQSLMFLEAVTHMAVMMGAIGSGIGEMIGVLPEGSARSEVALDSFVELTDTFVWDHYMAALDLILGTTNMRPAKRKSIYGRKITLGEAEALRLLGAAQSILPFDEIVTPTHKGDLRISQGATTTDLSTTSAIAIAMLLKQMSLLKSWERTMEAAALVDPTFEGDIFSAPLRARADAEFRSEWNARLNLMGHITGVWRESYLNLGKSMYYSGYNLDKLQKENINKMTTDEKLHILRLIQEGIKKGKEE